MESLTIIFMTISILIVIITIGITMGCWRFYKTFCEEMMYEEEEA